MINILYNDDSIVVAQKPSGIISEGEGENTFPSLLLNELTDNAHMANPPKDIYTVHRLDKETEGLMVYALSSAAAANLTEQIKSNSFKKQYVAKLSGIPESKSGRLRDLLYYDRHRGKSFVVQRQRKGVKEAILDYEVIGTKDDCCIVRVELLTGRTHQIRAQFASRGLPLCGDRRYGAPSKFGNRLCLVSTKLSFKHPKTKEYLEFEIAPPDFT